MALQIALHPLGVVLRGDPPIIWTDAVGNSRFTLEQLLHWFWCPMQPEGSDGPAIMVRFT